MLRRLDLMVTLGMRMIRACSDNTNLKDSEYLSIDSVYGNDLGVFETGVNAGINYVPSIRPDVATLNHFSKAISFDCMRSASNATNNMHKSPCGRVSGDKELLKVSSTLPPILKVDSDATVEQLFGFFGNDYVNSIANINSEFSSKMETLAGYGTTLPNMVSPSDPTIWSVDFNTKPKSYIGATGASAKDQPTVSNFCPLVADPGFDGVSISIPRKVDEKEKLGEHGLTRIMMNNKGLFFFKFNSRAGLEAVLEGGPWLIRKSPIILKNWSMDTRLIKEELTRILIWVKLHDGRSSFARCLFEVNSDSDLVKVVTIGVPSLIGDDFTKETIRVEYE
nr:hypothetical protein [Tanacetum cinerariifolium]